jgi:hypothetical protein
MRPWNFVALFLSLILLAPPVGPASRAGLCGAARLAAPPGGPARLARAGAPAGLLSVPLGSRHLPGTAQAQDARPDLGANAAMKYWQAFALLPILDKDQEKLLEQWNKVPLDAAAQKLIDKSRISRVYLHRGAKLQRCDWSLDYEDGIFLRLPYLVKARTLARLTALHARHEFDQGHWKAGAEDVTALLKLARHLEREPIMIVQLVGYAIEAIAIEAAAPSLPELKPVMAQAVSDVLDALPAGPTLPQMVVQEKQTGPMWLIKELKKAEKQKEGSWHDVWKEVLSAPGEGDSVDRDLVNSATTFEQAIKLLEDVLPFYDELEKMMALPWKEFDAQYPQFVKKAKAANPLAGYILPAMDNMVAAQRRNQTQLALFKAALAVVQGGPDRLKDFKDPFGDGPFEHRALDKGFELKSKLLFKGQPVMLTVGKGKKE